VFLSAELRPPPAQEYFGLWARKRPGASRVARGEKHSDRSTIFHSLLPTESRDAASCFFPDRDPGGSFLQRSGEMLMSGNGFLQFSVCHIEALDGAREHRANGV
jgi:hypothetical protein